MGNYLKDYYDAMQRGDEYAAIDAAEIKKKIEAEEEAASWNGREPDYNYSHEMGS